MLARISDERHDGEPGAAPVSVIGWLVNRTVRALQNSATDKRTVARLQGHDGVNEGNDERVERDEYRDAPRHPRQCCGSLATADTDRRDHTSGEESHAARSLARASRRRSYGEQT